MSKPSYLEIVHARTAEKMSILSQNESKDSYELKGELIRTWQNSVRDVANAAVKSTDKEMRRWRTEDIVLLRSKVAESFADLADEHGFSADTNKLNHDLRGKKDGHIIATTDWRKRRSEIMRSVLDVDTANAFTDALAQKGAKDLLQIDPKDHTKELTSRILASGHSPEVQERLGIHPDVIEYALAFAGENPRGTKQTELQTAWQKASRRFVQQKQSDSYHEKIAPVPETPFQQLAKSQEGK